MKPPGERVAAIDVGSNTILLTVAEYDPATGLTTIEDAEDQPRLGAGLSATGRLGEDAIQRALVSLARMHGICRRHDVQRLAAVATAAVRDAENGPEFVERVNALGIPLRTISPETEAALAYRSAAHHFPTMGRQLVADIGGGSLELIGSENGRVKTSESLPLGAVRLTELGLSVEALRDHIGRGLGKSVRGQEWRGSALIGSGGTFASVASMVLARRGTPGRPIHGVAVTLADVEQLLGKLSNLSLEQRRQTPGLKSERADIIVAGLAVAAELLVGVGSEVVTVSGYGLRDGVLLEMVGLT